MVFQTFGIPTSKSTNLDKPSKSINSNKPSKSINSDEPFKSTNLDELLKSINSAKLINSNKQSHEYELPESDIRIQYFLNRIKELVRSHSWNS